MTGPALELPADLLEERRAQVREDGPLSVDAIAVAGRCAACGRLVGLWAATHVAGRAGSLKEIVDGAAKAAARKARRAAPTACSGCGEAVRPTTAVYLVRHSGRAHDILIVVSLKKGFFGSHTVTLLKSDDAGAVVPLGELSSEEEARLVADIPFRKAWAELAFGDRKRALSLVRALAAIYPGDALLLRFVPALLNKGETEVALALAGASLEARPDDADAHYWSGEAIFTRVNQRQEPAGRLADAQAAFDRAVALGPGHLRASLSRCNLLRLQKRSDVAIAAFGALLREHPDCAEAHYNLAVMVLDADPATALAHFVQGERLVVEDPDYPVGCARALLRLGRKAEAGEALKRARNLTAAHPGFAEIEHGLTHGPSRPEDAVARKAARASPTG